MDNLKSVNYIMDRQLEFEGYIIKPLFLEQEINYEIFDSKGYVCRLVPGYLGFELSKHDKSLNNLPAQEVIAKLSDFIVSKDA